MQVMSVWLLYNRKVTKLNIFLKVLLSYSGSRGLTSDSVRLHNFLFVQNIKEYLF